MSGEGKTESEALRAVAALYEAIDRANELAAQEGRGWRLLRCLEVVQVDPDQPDEPPDPPEPEATTGSTCPNCQSPNVRPMGGCETCMDCGESVGGCG